MADTGALLAAESAASLQSWSFSSFLASDVDRFVFSLTCPCVFLLPQQAAKAQQAGAGTFLLYPKVGSKAGHSPASCSTLTGGLNFLLLSA